MTYHAKHIVRPVTEIRTAAFLVIASLLALRSGPFAQQLRADVHWVGTWATASVARQPPAQSDPRTRVQFKNETLRQIVRTSIGGTQVRLVLTNAFGTAPLAVGAVHVAIRDKGPAIVAGSSRPVTFSGAGAATIPAGAVLVSDPVNLAVPAFADVAVDIFVAGDAPAAGSPATMHGGARQTNFISEPGNHVGAAAFPVQGTTASWFYLARLEVAAPNTIGAVVTLGDSITDGYMSTPDANSRWPDHLAKRLGDSKNGLRMGVMNLGIDGNRVLVDGLGVSALARFDRDVLAQTGATHVIVLEGINDLGLARQSPRPSTADLVAGHRQLIARARAHNLKVLAGTLLPFEGATFPDYFSAEGDATRQAFNQWLRTGKEYDGIIDFDTLVRDAARPARLLPRYDSGDHLHPSDAGYEAMGNAVNVAFFKREALRSSAAARVERPATSFDVWPTLAIPRRAPF